MHFLYSLKKRQKLIIKEKYILRIWYVLHLQDIDGMDADIFIIINRNHCLIISIRICNIFIKNRIIFCVFTLFCQDLTIRQSYVPIIRFQTDYWEHHRNGIMYIPLTWDMLWETVPRVSSIQRNRWIQIKHCTE